METCCSGGKHQNAIRSEIISVDCHSEPQGLAKKKRRMTDRNVLTGIIKAMPASNLGRHVMQMSRNRAGAASVRPLDVERGYQYEQIHISVVITGMTCTGCSRKALNALHRIPGVADARVNFIASTGEFDLDSRLNPAEAISQLERETGFTCSRFIKDCQKLNVLMSRTEAKCFEENLPVGVESVSRVDPRIHSITFNPSIIGARSVLRNVPTRQLAGPRSDVGIVRNKQRLIGLALKTTLAAACTIPVVVLAWSDNSVPHDKRSMIALGLATCVQAIAVPEFYVGALQALIFSKMIEMDLLVSISVTAAYAYSVIAFALANHGVVLTQGAIFETSTLLTTLILLGRLITIVARAKAFAAISTNSSQCEIALRLDKCGKILRLDARLLQYGDSIFIAPHTRVVTDGVVIRGSSKVDESIVTGECTPVDKSIGDPVIAGTMNLVAPLCIRLTRLPGQNSITDIASLVEDALGAKPRLQDLADKIASWFIPVIVGISCVVFAVWLSVAFMVRHYGTGDSFGLAIGYTIAVLAVSCPCALGLAVPMVLIVAGGVAAKSGIIIKQASVTEGAHRTTDIVFDKTGTLTSGDLEVVEEKYYHEFIPCNETKSLLLCLIEGNNHPVSSALTRRLQSITRTSYCLEEIRSIPGSGVKAGWKGKTVKAGNPSWLDLESHLDIRRFEEKGLTILAVTVDKELIVVYGLQTKLRAEARAVIQDLHRRKISCHIVSGDGTEAVNDIARSLDIDRRHTSSHQVPAQKRDYVKSLIDQGKTVLFCGDGTNDAVAVAQAQFGIQIGSASDITKATADVFLTGGLECIPALLDISRAAYMRIVFNFVWSALYNLFAVLLAAGAFVEFRIPPAYAGLGELVSVLPLIFVALSLMRFKRKAL